MMGEPLVTGRKQLLQPLTSEKKETHPEPD